MAVRSRSHANCPYKKPPPQAEVFLWDEALWYNDGMSKKILLIEDDEFLHQLYTELLTGEGYAVTGIMDGKEAYEKIKENNWDVVLLDVMLPGMDGFEIMDRLHKEKISMKCPVIFLTNLDSTESDKKNLEKAQDHWTKSDMSPPEFVQKVKEVLK